jgi:hypothetical protein
MRELEFSEEGEPDKRPNFLALFDLKVRKPVPFERADRSTWLGDKFFRETNLATGCVSWRTCALGFLARLLQPHPGASHVFVDELDVGRFIARRLKLGSF